MEQPAEVPSEIPENANEGCVGPESEGAGKSSACAGCPNQSDCSSGKFKQPDPALGEVSDRMADIKHIILVLSGKGGVGKSSCAAQLSWALAGRGFQVGLLDIDICGPSAPHMMGVSGEEIRKSSFGWSPVYADDNLGVISVGLMLNSKTDAVIWRGPRKNGLIKEFLTEVYWGELDFLIIDAPPGTSDEHISIAQFLKKSSVDGAVIVTTPQEVSLLDVRKEISFCRKTKIPVLGVVENMSGFICPCCKTKTDIFIPSSGGAKQMSEEMKVPFLGAIPLDPNLLKACEEGKSFFKQYPDSPAVAPFQTFISTLLASTPSLAATAIGAVSEEKKEKSSEPKKSKVMKKGGPCGDQCCGGKSCGAGCGMPKPESEEAPKEGGEESEGCGSGGCAAGTCAQESCGGGSKESKKAGGGCCGGKSQSKEAAKEGEEESEGCGSGGCAAGTCAQESCGGGSKEEKKAVSGGCCGGGCNKSQVVSENPFVHAMTPNSESPFVYSAAKESITDKSLSHSSTVSVLLGAAAGAIFTFGLMRYVR